MYESTSLREWLSGLSAGTAALALICLALSFADADAADFDPRPAFRLLRDSAAVSLRDAGVSLAALLLLLTPAPASKEAVR